MVVNYLTSRIKSFVGFLAFIAVDSTGLAEHLFSEETLNLRVDADLPCYMRSVKALCVFVLVNLLTSRISDWSPCVT